MAASRTRTKARARRKGRSAAAAATQFAAIYVSAANSGERARCVSRPRAGFAARGGGKRGETKRRGRSPFLVSDREGERSRPPSLVAAVTVTCVRVSPRAGEKFIIFV